MWGPLTIEAKADADYVYPCAVFQRSEDRDEFVRNGLKWDRIDPAKLAGFLDFNIGWTAAGGARPGYARFSNDQTRHIESASVYAVMEKVKRVKDEIKVSARLQNDILPYGPFLDGAANRFLITCTNTAPYPVSIGLRKPSVNVSASTYPNVNLKWSNGSDLLMIIELQPYEQTTWNNYEFTLADARDASKQAPSQVKNGYLAFDIPMVNYSFAPGMAGGGAAGISKTTLLKAPVPGNKDYDFAVAGVAPDLFNLSETPKTVHLTLRCPDLLSTVTVAKMPGGSPVSVPATATSTPGICDVNLTAQLAATGEYELKITNTSNASVATYIIKVNETATSKLPDSDVKRLLVGQHKSTGLIKDFRNTVGFNANDYNLLLDIAGSSSDAAGGLIFKTGTAINGLLKVKGGDVFWSNPSGESTVASLSPLTGGGNNAQIYYVKGNGSDEWAMTTPLDFKIALNAGSGIYETAAPAQDYAGNYGPHRGVMLDFLGTKTVRLGGAPIVDTRGLYLYRSPDAGNNPYFSLTGKVDIGQFLGTAVKTFLDVPANVEDFRLAAYGFDGMRGDFSGFVGYRDPAGILTFGGSSAIGFDLLPETQNPWFRMSGGIEIGPIGGLSGELSLKRVDANVGQNRLGQFWMPDDIAVTLNAPIPLCPPVPVVLSTLGGHVTGLAESTQIALDWTSGNFSKVIPPFNYGPSLGVEVVESIAEIEGTGNIGLTSWGTVDTKFVILLIPILQDGHSTMGLEDTGETIQIGGLNLPGVNVAIDMGGTINLLNVFTGTANIGMLINLGYLARWANFDVSKVSACTNWAQYQTLHRQYPFIRQPIPIADFNTTKPLIVNDCNAKKTLGLSALAAFHNNPNMTWQQYAQTAASGTKSLYEVLKEVMNFEVNGNITVKIPEGTPFGGMALFNAKAGLDMDKIWGALDFKLKAGVSFGPVNFSFDKDIEVTVTSHYGFGWVQMPPEVVVETRSATLPRPGDPLYGRGFDVGPSVSLRSAGAGAETPQKLYMPNLVAMVKDSEVWQGGITTRAFSGTYSNTKTQTMQNLSRTFVVAARSKSNATGLKITGPNGIAAERTAADIDWQTADGFYAGTVCVNLPAYAEAIALGASPADAAAVDALDLNGLWTVEAWDAAVTAFDAAGLIDCDFYYSFSNASVSNLAFNSVTGEATWDLDDLDPAATYRMKLSATDGSKTWTLCYSDEFTGAASPAGYVLPAALFEDMRDLLTGNYKLIAAIEKHDGYLDVPNLPAGIDPPKEWLVQSSTETAAAFAHVNPHQPDPVTAVAATVENGSAIVSWTPPAVMNLVSGYAVSIIDFDGNITAGLRAGAADTQIIIEPKTDPSAPFRYGGSYTFSVAPFHEYTVGTTVMRVESNALETAPALVIQAPAERPFITEIQRFLLNGSNREDEKVIFSDPDYAGPEKIQGMSISLQSRHTLELTTFIWDISPVLSAPSLRISEEMNSYNQTNAGVASPPPPTFTDESARISVSGITASISFAGMTEGNYVMDVKLTGNGGVYHIFRFNLTIDDTPPDLLVSGLMKNSEDNWVISGATEAGATLSFNGSDITALVSSGNFTVQTDEDLSHAYFLSTDEAGNSTKVTGILNGITPLPTGDNATDIRILAPTRMLTGDTQTAEAEVESAGTFAPPAAGTVAWSVVRGGAFVSINATTGDITAAAPGTALIEASYKGALKAVAEITVANEFAVSDLHVSAVTSPTSVTVSFTEPQGATGKAMEYSADEPVAGEVTTGWTAIPATFDNSGNAAVSGLPADKTVYLRMTVTGGINQGISNIAGRGDQTTEPPHITGPASLTLTAGYAATSTAAFTVTGNPSPTVAKTSGDAHLAWNGTTMQIDIAPGLAAGDYPVVLTATNGVAPDAAFTFTLHVTPPPLSYAIIIDASAHGTVTASASSATAGSTVTLTVTPDAGYVLYELRVTRSGTSYTFENFYGAGNTRTFTMPAYGVNASATFQPATYQPAWNAALALIESATFTLTQAEAADADLARYRLASLINELIAPTGFVISPSDIVIFYFSPALAGTSANNAGTAGRFEFRDTPPDTRASAYSSGAITPTVYIVGNEVVSGVAPLQAWTVNGMLYVSGLTPGELWSVYNMSGVLIYQGVANADASATQTLSLPERGAYIVLSGGQTVKIVN
jgi:hypothetical protein